MELHAETGSELGGCGSWNRVRADAGNPVPSRSRLTIKRTLDGLQPVRVTRAEGGAGVSRRSRA